ncbi:MAG: hypothetical protein LH468_03375 [Nocardioides sp.]|nr:hypothetical protein [Nocardioides sp.]
MSRLLLPPGLQAVSAVAGRLRAWPVRSQQAARRNAMVACTAAAARRAEREDVEEFLTLLATARRDAARAAHG